MRQPHDFQIGDPVCVEYIGGLSYVASISARSPMTVHIGATKFFWTERGWRNEFGRRCAIEKVEKGKAQGAA